MTRAREENLGRTRGRCIAARAGEVRQMLEYESKEEKVRVLFCCAANMCRSPTGEHLLALVEGYDAKSAGVCKGARVEVSQKLLNWADVVFVMEYWMKEQLLLHFRVKADKIKVLGIKDRHFYGELELVRTIAERLKRYGIDATHVVNKFKPVGEDGVWQSISARASRE